MLPVDLVQQAAALAPAELRGNLNRLTVTALREFVERRRAQAFSEAMQAMAADPAIRKECVVIGEGLADSEGDGLRGRA